MTDNYNNVYKKYLYKNEHIIWSGKPDPKIHFTYSDFIIIPFSLLFGITTILWEVQSFLNIQKNGISDLYYGIPLIIGFYFIIGRFIFKIWKKKRTYYAITDKRIVIIIKYWGLHLLDIRMNSISNIKKRINASGAGTLIFKERNPGFLGIFFKNHFSLNNTGLDFLPFYSEVGFYDIKEAEKAYNIIKEQLNVKFK